MMRFFHSIPWLMRIVAAAALLSLAAMAAWVVHERATTDRTLDGYEVKPGALGGAFTLSNPGGPPASAETFRGKVIMLTFGYASCPDVCPLTLSEFAKAKRELGPLGREVMGVFVSVDPERDNADRLRDFTAQFDPSFLALTGDRGEINAMVERFGAQYVIDKREGKADYEVGHTAFSYLLGRDGQVRYLFPLGVGPDMIARGLRRLLSSSG